MTFHVGQKVVCIRSFHNPFLDAETARHLRFPSVGETYTIRDLGECCIMRTLQIGVRLQEIENPAYNTAVFGFREPMFRACDFRPIVHRKTDISIFTDMLIPSDEKIGASI